MIIMYRGHFSNTSISMTNSAIEIFIRWLAHKDKYMYSLEGSRGFFFLEFVVDREAPTF